MRADIRSPPGGHPAVLTELHGEAEGRGFNSCGTARRPVRARPPRARNDGCVHGNYRKIALLHSVHVECSTSFHSDRRILMDEQNIINRAGLCLRSWRTLTSPLVLTLCTIVRDKG